LSHASYAKTFADQVTGVNNKSRSRSVQIANSRISTSWCGHPPYRNFWRQQ